MANSFVYNPPQLPLVILYQDRDLLVVNKPSGILTNPGRGEALADSLLSRVQQAYPGALLVHRLDLSTSGVVVFALRRKAERELKRQFAERLVKKRYLAVVAGLMTSKEGIITLPLRADPLNPPTQQVHAEGKTAETAYRVLQESSKDHLERTLVELRPVTGRSHQLRVHMAALGHPILGDTFYAPESVHQAAPRLLLHAAELSLFQPYNQQPLTFVADTDFVSSNGHWPNH
ncbi:pseudouridine synthase [Alishewanella longhuensis]|uniref:Pseudouridine synthase n=1 Tax=Alishewanella longhuensis TaxID=1091037 RepID=A0ABQ3KZ51_9ALTE|nr:RluA family pseudouridine synthase [Alishewanella longhuensis]GHG68190.1 pseudouridine synthase [Alishewanella longhuensis]